MCGYGTAEITEAAHVGELSCLRCEEVCDHELRLHTKSFYFAQTYLAVLGGISKEMFGLGFLPLVFGTEKQVWNLLGKAGWKVLQKNRKRMIQ